MNKFTKTDIKCMFPVNVKQFFCTRVFVVKSDPQHDWHCQLREVNTNEERSPQPRLVTFLHPRLYFGKNKKEKLTCPFRQKSEYGLPRKSTKLIP